MKLAVEIAGEEVPITVEYVEFWIAEFMESWKCARTHQYHPKGDTFRVPGDPRSGNQTHAILGDRRMNSEYQVPFSILDFRHIKHAIHTLRHVVTVVTPLEDVEER
jgi:hypothetical protein